MNLTLIPFLVLTQLVSINVQVITSQQSSEIRASFLNIEPSGHNESSQAAFSASQVEGDVPLTVTFDASSTVGEGEFDWVFGSGGEAEGVIVEHTFVEVGEFLVNLVITQDGIQSNASKVIKVTGEEPAEVLQASFEGIADEIRYAEGSNVRVAGYGSSYVDSAETVPVRNHELGYGTYSLLIDANDEVVATDWIIPGEKLSLYFDARNTTLAEILVVDELLSWPREHFFQLYARFEEHPKFAEALEIVRSNGSAEFVDDDDFREIYSLFQLIAIDTAQAYAIEKGWVDLDGGTVTFPSPTFP